MGSHNDSVILFVNTKKKETIQSVWDKYIDELLFKHGHDPYNGTLSTCRGMFTTTLPSEINPNKEKDVFEYIWGNTEKWKKAMAIKVSEKDCIEKWLIGGWSAE